MINDHNAIEEANKTRAVAIRAMKLAIDNLTVQQDPKTITQTISLSANLVSAAQECKDRYGDEYPYETPEHKQELEDCIHRLLKLITIRSEQ